MATACQILFKNSDSGRSDSGSLLVYKHSDGYPEEIIPLLREFWKWYSRPDDFEAMLATWFYFCKQKQLESLRKQKQMEIPTDKSNDEIPWDSSPIEAERLNRNHPIARSYGICADGRMHEDIEHFYVVDAGSGVVECYSPDGVEFDAETPDEITSRNPDDSISLLE